MKEIQISPEHKKEIYTILKPMIDSLIAMGLNKEQVNDYLSMFINDVTEKMQKENTKTVT